jgi:hypothetical protein
MAINYHNLKFNEKICVQKNKGFSKILVVIYKQPQSPEKKITYLIKSVAKTVVKIIKDIPPRVKQTKQKKTIAK